MHGADFSPGKVNVTPASQEQCSRLQQSSWCRYWFSLLRTPQQCLTMVFSGPDDPQELPLPLGMWTPSNTWLLGLTRITHSNGISVGSSVFLGCQPTRHMWRVDLFILHSAWRVDHTVVTSWLAAFTFTIGLCYRRSIRRLSVCRLFTITMSRSNRLQRDRATPTV